MLSNLNKITISSKERPTWITCQSKTTKIFWTNLYTVTILHITAILGGIYLYSCLILNKKYLLHNIGVNCAMSSSQNMSVGYEWSTTLVSPVNVLVVAQGCHPRPRWRIVISCDNVAVVSRVNLAKRFNWNMFILKFKNVKSLIIIQLNPTPPSLNQHSLTYLFLT